MSWRTRCANALQYLYKISEQDACPGGHAALTHYNICTRLASKMLSLQCLYKISEQDACPGGHARCANALQYLYKISEQDALTTMFVQD